MRLLVHFLSIMLILPIFKLGLILKSQVKFH